MFRQCILVLFDIYTCFDKRWTTRPCLLLESNSYFCKRWLWCHLHTLYIFLKIILTSNR